jgi:hypothetical protein
MLPDDDREEGELASESSSSLFEPSAAATLAPQGAEDDESDLVAGAICGFANLWLVIRDYEGRGRGLRI